MELTPGLTPALHYVDWWCQSAPRIRLVLLGLKPAQRKKNMFFMTSRVNLSGERRNITFDRKSTLAKGGGVKTFHSPEDD